MKFIKREKNDTYKKEGGKRWNNIVRGYALSIHISLYQNSIVHRGPKTQVV